MCLLYHLFSVRFASEIVTQKQMLVWLDLTCVRVHNLAVVKSSNTAVEVFRQFGSVLSRRQWQCRDASVANVGMASGPLVEPSRDPDDDQAEVWHGGFLELSCVDISGAPQGHMIGFV